MKKNYPCFGGLFEIEAKLARLSEIAHIESMDGFWNDSANASKIQQ